MYKKSFMVVLMHQFFLQAFQKRRKRMRQNQRQQKKMLIDQAGWKTGVHNDLK
ncbi:hypothetical protein M3204_06680 [Mesobacillus subterraneus]|jgi:hypothetical protein|uniref:hypothetical protein n=1 Tax=Mesobacillus subterraneus TaxID=285983 RepID=UPI00203A7252|nr:hypothetical protein [Mesobacillus subterraneus]MCM3664080.1 hypothetical protein [Mesobacillus subterraneus]MCM3685572.1 hypothetical protein [Mesobacillus subterraneus]